MSELPAFVGTPEVNRIYNTDALTLLRACKSRSVDLTLTDIPYGAVNRQTNGLRLIDKGVADVVNFDLFEVAAQIERVTRGSIYIFCEWAQISDLIEYYRHRHTVRLCTWEKTNPSPMNGEHVWLSSTEYCVFVKKSGAVFNEHCRSSVWRCPTESDQLHPTQKPERLMRRLIAASSRPGDLVCDPFAGSGSSLLAAYLLERDYIGSDTSMEYVEIARRRLAQPYTVPMFVA